MMKISMRHTAGALAFLLAMTATGVATADALPPAARVQSAQPAGEVREMPPPPGVGPHFGGPGPRGPAASGGPAFAAVRTIEEIAHLYRVGGHPENVLPFYRETLSQTRDPILRHHLREAIAREELKPADTTAAISTLRAQLSEDLAALPPPSSDAKRR
ncbi:hypothetical protein [Pandoraea apista]|nr:hypothetical protein [Pandoraea apista]AVF38620.1 hypothetical protein AL486_01965 [Pandoraea apista]OXS94715.1 hypothetical protein B7H01_09370 [Pandoraea apista]